MTQSPIHILNQTGVMSSFSVAKRISEREINRYYVRQRKTGKKDPEIGRMLKQKILGDIQTAFTNNEIPGLLTPEELAESLGLDKNIIKNMPELNRLIAAILHKLTEKNYDKMSMCYFINAIVNTLDLSEEDFNKFHEQSGGGEDGDESEPEDGGFV